MITLHGFAASNYYNIAKYVLLYKEIPFEEHLVYGGGEEWLSISPVGKIPALTTEDGRDISESSVICDYLEEAYPGSLRMMHREGGEEFELAKANGAGENSHLPNFSPFDDGGYFWLAFYSTRDYGNAHVGTKGQARRQIWVTAISNEPQTGTDPSHVPYWLPDQDPSTHNMSAYWSLPPPPVVE